MDSEKQRNLVSLSDHYRYVTPVACVLGFIVVWFPSALSSFLSDDFGLIQGLKDHGIFGVWSSRGSPFFRPIVSMSLFLDYSIWGDNSAGFHISSLILHVINSILAAFSAYSIIQGLMPDITRRINCASLAGIVFLLLPSHGEAVYWIASRTDLMGVLFFQLAFIGYLRGIINQSPGFFVASWIFALLSLLSKESAISLLPIFMFLAYLFIRQPNTAMKPAKWTFIGILGHSIILISFWTVRSRILGSWIGGYGAETHIPIKHLYKVLNIPLMMIRSVLPYQSSISLFIASMALFLCLIWMLVRLMPIATQRSLNKAFIICLILLCISVLPVFPLGISLKDSQSERLIYGPSIFSACFIGIVLSEIKGLLPRIQRIVVLLPLICLLFLGRTSMNFFAAGKLTQEIIRSTCSFAQKDPVVILNLPDNCAGVYVFRDYFVITSGIMCANSLGVSVLALHSIRSIQESVECTISDKDIQLTLEPSMRFVRIVNEQFRSKTHFFMSQVKSNQVQISWSVIPDRASILYYTEGRLCKIERPGRGVGLLP